MERSRKLPLSDRTSEQDNEINRMREVQNDSKNSESADVQIISNDAHNYNAESKQTSKDEITVDRRQKANEMCYSRPQEKHGHSCRESKQSVSHNGNKNFNSRSHSNPVQSASSLHSNNTYHVKSTATSRTTSRRRESMSDINSNQINKRINLPREMLSSAELSHIMHELNWCRANIINRMYALEQMELEREAIEVERRNGAVIINDNLSLYRLREELNKIYAEYAESEQPYVVMRMIDNTLDNSPCIKKCYYDDCNTCIDRDSTIVRAREMEEENNDLRWESCQGAVETIVEELTNILEKFYLPSHLFRTVNSNNSNDNNNNANSSNADESVHAAQTKFALLSYFRKFFEIGVRYVPTALSYLQSNNIHWTYNKEMEIRLGEEEVNVIRQLYLALIHNVFTFAFSCPCAPLQIAAQLVLAHALAQRDEWSDDDCFGIVRYLPEIKRSCRSMSTTTCEHHDTNIECNDGQGNESNLHNDATVSHVEEQNSYLSARNTSEVEEMQQIIEESEEKSERLQESEPLEISERNDSRVLKEQVEEKEEREKQEESVSEQSIQKQNREQEEKISIAKDNISQHAASNTKICNSTSANENDTCALDETRLRSCKLCEEERQQERESLYKLLINHTLSDAHIRASDKLLWLYYGHHSSQWESAYLENNNKGLEECSTSESCKSHVRLMDIKQWLSLSTEAQRVHYSKKDAVINIPAGDNIDKIDNEEKHNEEEIHTNVNSKHINNWEEEQKRCNETCVEGKAFLLMTPAITTALPVTDRVIVRDDGHKLVYIQRYLELMLLTLEETQQAHRTQRRNIANRRVSKNKIKYNKPDDKQKIYEKNSGDDNSGFNIHTTNNRHHDKKEKRTVEREKDMKRIEQCSKSNEQLELEEQTSESEEQEDEDDDTDEEVFRLNSTPRFNSPRRQRLRWPQSSHSRQNEQQEQQQLEEEQHGCSRAPTSLVTSEEKEKTETTHENHSLTQHTTLKKYPSEEKQILPYFFHHNKRKMRHLLRALLKCQYFTSPMQRRGSKEVLYFIYSELDRCPGYCHLLSLFPELLHAHHASLSFTLFGDGPLPIDVRLMIAIMAASRHGCHSLVSRFAAIMQHHYGDSRLEEEYVDEDILEVLQIEEQHELEKKESEWEEELSRENTFLGSNNTFRTETAQHSIMGQRFSSLTATQVNKSSFMFAKQHNKRTGAWNELYMGKERRVREKWLSHHPPHRLCQLQEVIALAAHTPWRLTEQHMACLLNNKWTIPQLMHCIAIVAIVIPLCSFIEGMFVPTKPWTALILPPQFRSELLHDAKRCYERNERKKGSVAPVSNSFNQLTGSSADLYSSHGGSSECVNNNNNNNNYYYINKFDNVNKNSSSSELDQYTACIAPEFPTQEQINSNFNNQFNIATKQTIDNDNNTSNTEKHHTHKGNDAKDNNRSDSDSSNNSGNSNGNRAECKKEQEERQHKRQQNDIGAKNNRKAEQNTEQRDNETSSQATNLFLRFTGYPEIKSTQRIYRLSSKDYKSLSRNEFNWEDMGAFIMEQYYSGAAMLISRELNAFTDIIREVNELDCVGVKKSPSSSAWYTFHSLRMYVLNLIGVTEDGYAYNDINSVLCIPAKQFAQILTLRPETLSRSDLKTLYCKNLTFMYNTWLHDDNDEDKTNNKGIDVVANNSTSTCNNTSENNNNNNVATSAHVVSPFDSLSCHQVLRESELCALYEQSVKSLTSKKRVAKTNNSCANNISSSTTTTEGHNSANCKSTQNPCNDSFDMNSNQCHSTDDVPCTHVAIMKKLAQGINWQDDEMLQTALALQEERVLLLIALATMEARKEGLLNMLLYKLSAAINKL